MVDRTFKIVCLEIQRNINRRFFSLSIVIFVEGEGREGKNLL